MSNSCDFFKTIHENVSLVRYNYPAFQGEVKTIPSEVFSVRNLIDLIQQQSFVTRSDRHDVVHRQVAQHAAFDLNLFGIGFPLHFGSGFELHLREYAHAGEHR